MRQSDGPHPGRLFNPIKKFKGQTFTFFYRPLSDPASARWKEALLGAFAVFAMTFSTQFLWLERQEWPALVAGWFGPDEEPIDQEMLSRLELLDGTGTPVWIRHLSKSRNFYRHDDLIWEAATKSGIDPDLWKAVVMVESAGQAGARSNRGAVGLAQLTPETAMDVGLKPDDHYDPQANLQAGAKYLNQLMRQFGGNLRYALAAYNAGPGTVMRYGGVPSFRETRRYISSVMMLYQWLKKNPDHWSMSRTRFLHPVFYEDRVGFRNLEVAVL